MGYIYNTLYHTEIIPSRYNPVGTTAPAHTLEVAGTAANTGGGSWLTISDVRMKNIEGDYEYGLDEIKRLHTVRFKYKEGNAVKVSSFCDAGKESKKI